MTTSLLQGALRVRLDAIAPSDCSLEHHNAGYQELPFERKLDVGVAGTVMQISPDITAFRVGDHVVACLSRQQVLFNTTFEQIATFNAKSACKVPSTVSKRDAARIATAFVCATSILHSIGNIPVPFLALTSSNEEQLPPRNILVIAGDSMIPLIVIRLLRLYTYTAIFAVLEPKTIAGDLSIKPAGSCGAHFVQQPSSMDSVPDVAQGLRSNLGHYGPYANTGCFELVLDLTGNNETPEPYQRLLSETGKLYQLPRTMRVDLEWLFGESCIMSELTYMLESRDIRLDEMYDRREARSA